MKQRVITAVIGVALMIPVCWFSHTWIFPLMFSLLSVIAAYEALRCVGAFQKWCLSIPAMLLSVVFPFVYRFFTNDTTYFLTFSGVFFIFLLYCLTLSVFSKGHYTTEHVAVSFAMVLYVTASFSSIVLLRDLKGGEYLYLLVFIGPWASDMFAYFCGRAFGKHKLIPEISPHKTVEGSIGALLLTPFFVMLYGWIIDGGMPFNWFSFALIGLILSLLGQIGDLVASAIKRQYGIKDYGKLFPGHGGVLDRFDSNLMTAPILFLVCYWIF